MALYKVTSAKEGNEAEAIVVDGNYSEGGRRAAVGETIELSDAEHESLSSLFNMHKVGEEVSSDSEDSKTADDVPDASVEEGAGSDAGGSGATGLSTPAARR